MIKQPLSLIQESHALFQVHLNQRILRFFGRYEQETRPSQLVPVLYVFQLQELAADNANETKHLNMHSNYL